MTDLDVMVSNSMHNVTANLDQHHIILLPQISMSVQLELISVNKFVKTLSAHIHVAVIVGLLLMITTKELVLVRMSVMLH